MEATEVVVGMVAKGGGGLLKGRNCFHCREEMGGQKRSVNWHPVWTGSAWQVVCFSMPLYCSYTIVLTPSQAFCPRTFDIAWETRNSFLRGKTFLHRGVRFEPPLRGAISLLLNLKRCLVCSPASYRAERFLESYSSRRLNCTVRLFTPFRDLRNCCFAPGSWVSIVFAMSEILFGYF